MWALEITFKVIELVDPIPTEKEEFTAAVSESLSTIAIQDTVSLDVVNMALMVSDYFLTHKLILSNLERDSVTGEFICLHLLPRKKILNYLLKTQQLNEKVQV